MVKFTFPITFKNTAGWGSLRSYWLVAVRVHQGLVACGYDLLRDTFNVELFLVEIQHTLIFFSVDTYVYHRGVVGNWNSPYLVVWWWQANAPLKLILTLLWILSFSIVSETKTICLRCLSNSIMRCLNFHLVERLITELRLLWSYWGFETHTVVSHSPICW